MSKTIETQAEAWQRRTNLHGTVDFTMMYVAHDAFNRDLARLVAAAGAGRGLSPEAVATWRFFGRQLHIHHTAEDEVLWPRLYQVVGGPDEIGILKAMEAEHASLDPLLEQLDAAIEHRNHAVLAAEFTALARGLSAHMRHEEEAALPLLERRVGEAGWVAFTKDIRGRTGGLSGAAAYLPWILDGASDAIRDKVLTMLPPPARLLCRRVWEPKYRRSGRLS